MLKTTWEQKNDGAVIRVPYRFDKNWCQWVLLTSDVHIDNKKCNQKKLKEILDLALERNALIIDNGDWFDVMGGKYDKRSTKSDILPKFAHGNYFDLVIEDSVEFLKPYAKNIAILGEGNHEQSVNQRHERNLTKQLIKDLNQSTGSNILHQQYDGFIKFQFEHDSPKGKALGGRSSLLMYRNHGLGGNAPVTMGVINTNRTQVMIDADIYVYGHIHQKWVIYRTKKSVNDAMKYNVKDQIHIQLSTFKDSKDSQWEVSKGFNAPSLGGAWLKFTMQKKHDTNALTPKCEVTLIEG